MATKTGVYISYKKDKSIYYRASITYKSKHISLGSFNTEAKANKAYNDARNVLDNPSIGIDDFEALKILSHDKFICLLNFRDNGIYFSTPIYLYKYYFEYYLSQHQILKFDKDDLFFYASHKIQTKGGYLFVSDYGSQYKILSRYGIKPFAVYERDFVMVNGDKNDMRYSNIKILNNYVGVLEKAENDGAKTTYTVVIHQKSNFIVGHYDDEITAAIAYNKAVDTLHANGFKNNYTKNYIVSINKDQYLSIYNAVKISDKISKLMP